MEDDDLLLLCQIRFRFPCALLSLYFSQRLRLTPLWIPPISVASLFFTRFNGSLSFLPPIMLCTLPLEDLSRPLSSHGYLRV